MSGPWNARQRAMLVELGLGAWLPPVVAEAACADPPGGELAAATEARSGRATALHAAEPPATAYVNAAPALRESSAGAGGATAAPPARPASAVAVGTARMRPDTRDEAAQLATPRVFSARDEVAPAVAKDSAGSAAANPPIPRPEVATLDWPELRATVAACTACALHAGRRQTVFGVGHPRAHWMIVGEAPGEQEDRQGEPFVGKSGQLLDHMLRAIGLGRQAPDDGTEGDPARRVYIANTVKCRPPNNRNPEPAELVRCEPYLVRQIALVQPRIILAMGRFAVQQLLRSDEPIGRLRGRVHRYQGVPLVVTYHPAYLLRNLDDKARAWEDLCLAVETLGKLGR